MSRTKRRLSWFGNTQGEKNRLMYSRPKHRLDRWRKRRRHRESFESHGLAFHLATTLWERGYSVEEIEKKIKKKMGLHSYEFKRLIQDSFMNCPSFYVYIKDFVAIEPYGDGTYTFANLGRPGAEVSYRLKINTNRWGGSRDDWILSEDKLYIIGDYRTKKPWQRPDNLRYDNLYPHDEKFKVIKPFPNKRLTKVMKALVDDYINSGDRDRSYFVTKWQKKFEIHINE